ncbi:MAG: glutamate--tRNA ligase [Actinobacteria bacterium]|nr:glutamate--tRNA ligase [Actinomycetota bacterium]
MKNESIRVRFAPSPTGFLHIGSARTAFFNWLFAKKMSGVFVLRIEDTDIERHREDTIELIMDSLKWLGITWDEGPDVGGSFAPYRQSLRKEIYSQYAQKLIAEKRAYRCFCSPDKLEDKRKASIKSKDSNFLKYDRECLKLTDKDIANNLAKGINYTIRLLVPDNKEINFKDIVYGKISVNSKIVEDFIIIRSNGLPTYNFSVAIDDIQMKITHVIRGEDHLSNTPKQVLIYNALNSRLPSFAHLPMILGSDGQKLSKRHGSISIEAYRDEGFLPEAIQNYLALLGWAYDEKTTIFSLEELIARFNLEDINKKPAKFDYEKLLWLNSSYIRNTDNKILSKLIYERFLKSAPQKKTDIVSEINIMKIEKIIPLIKERMKTVKEACELISPFFYKVRYTGEIKNFFENEKSEAANILNNAITVLEAFSDNQTTKLTFESSLIESELKKIAVKLGINFRKVAEVIRIALWGAKISPPLFGTMEILGRTETLKRLKAYSKNF